MTLTNKGRDSAFNGLEDENAILTKAVDDKSNEIDRLRGLLILAKKYAAQLPHDVIGESGAIRCYESDMKAINEALYKEKEDVG